MDELLREYLPILIFLAIAIAIAVVLPALSWLIVKQRPDVEKMSAYECGFEAFGDARRRFDVRFYLVAIMFIVVDLDLAFLYPYAVANDQLGLFGFWSLVIFLAVFAIGFLYDWRMGALEWE
ncbi:MAG: NADH-quinone oxidoreductase subunit A [Rhodospirillales bacterium]|nr:MAG: NADH-quinone oxidoreductase subunit A [Rhodospirillales bacterium]